MNFEQWWEENKERVSHLQFTEVLKYFAETAYRCGYRKGYDKALEDFE